MRYNNNLRIIISIHALRVEGDIVGTFDEADGMISIHALRVEGDYMLTGTDDTAENFYPRPPGGGRQHAPPSNVLTNCISIHALRVEGDSGHGFHVYYLLEISIHALRVEGDIDRSS